MMGLLLENALRCGSPAAPVRPAAALQWLVIAEFHLLTGKDQSAKRKGASSFQ